MTTHTVEQDQAVAAYRRSLRVARAASMDPFVPTATLWARVAQHRAEAERLGVPFLP